LNLDVRDDADAVAKHAADLIATLAREAIRARGRFTLAVSGGTTPWKMLAALREHELPWKRIQVWQVDERVAPAGHADRNLTSLKASFSDHVAVKVHPMPVEEAELESAAHDYAHGLPVFDLIHLGLGSDGHTASLVPGDPVLAVADRDVALTGAYKGWRRMTLTYPAISRARNVLWVVTGADKQDAIKRLLAGDHGIPAGRVVHKDMTLIADRAALPPPSDAEAEERRLTEDLERRANWKRWGPYLPERQWATVREDYSENGDAWGYFPFDDAAKRAYRWGEDGLLGFTDREGRLCFAMSLWNGQDPILKERMFGLTGPEGNHGEDVKESYFYLDSTPTHAYNRALYKYPQRAFPYERLRAENRSRSRLDREFDLEDSGVFDDDRYFDVFVEYAKRSPNDILIRITIHNRGPDAAVIHALPTLWFRNTWSWGRTGEGYPAKPSLTRVHPGALRATHATLGTFDFSADRQGELLFTENESNRERLWGVPNPHPHVKDAFDDVVLHGRTEAADRHAGTKAAFWYDLKIAPGKSEVLRLRLSAIDEVPPELFGPAFDATMDDRKREADAFYVHKTPPAATDDERAVLRQAWAGLLWTKQFYHYVVQDWLDGDPAQPTPPDSRGRNAEWSHHLYTRDVISVPDKWEYPWFAAWDLAFHMLPFARIDADFSKSQLELFLREWYMHPNGQIPAYEWNFSDVNPPVHAWGAWRVYKMTGPKGKRDTRFLAHVVQKLLMNFTWWVNRKDVNGQNLFSGGFLGLDNIGVFDRSQPLPTGGTMEQADGTAWMAFYCTTMLAMTMELAQHDAAYADLASKFFEHFVAIADAMNTLGGSGLWDEEDGFYYDRIRLDNERDLPLRIRSMVGIIPLFAVLVLEESDLRHLPGFTKRMRWFLENRPHLAKNITGMDSGHQVRRMLAIPTKERLIAVLKYVLDENEFLSPWGVRSLSRVHRDHPFVMYVQGREYRVDYVPGDSDTGLFGGNSNWRGPIWLPVNWLLIEALERYHYFYGDELQVECPTGSGIRMNLQQVAVELSRRLASLFLPGEDGKRPCNGGDSRFETDAHWQDLVPFHEFFHAETGRGLGAAHQTGWTALVVSCIERMRKG
jgi:6-phosphogluconolactonase